MIQEQERVYAYWLLNISGIGTATAEKLISVFDSAKDIYNAGQSEIEKLVGPDAADRIQGSKKVWDVEGEYEQLVQKQITFLPFWQEGYPKRLLSVPRKPSGIYVKGRLSEEEKKAVAVIGTRNCSPYGDFIAREFSKTLARAGVEIISGMARGIDSISQQAALDAGGSSVAVFGCGVDICYPKSCQKLYEMLLERGGIVSAYPPGMLPKPELFPPRNRIISGLADVVLVVEAALKSGTMITVDMALEQGKDVYVVPGRLTDRCSDGCNHLLKQGAGIVLSPEDMLKELQMTPVPKQKKKKADKLAKQERMVLERLDFQPKSVEQIHSEVPEIHLQEIMRILIQFCLSGQADCIGGSYYVRKQGEMPEGN